MMKYIITIIVVLSLLLTGCAQQDPLTGYCNDNEQAVVTCEGAPITNTTVNQEPVDVIIGDNNTVVVIEDNKTEDQIADIPKDVKYDIQKEYEEGALVDFSKLEVKDPDGDLIKLTYSSPLNENGKWQTKAGDKGEYPVVISASDGKSETKLYALITITRENLPPTITVDDKITVLEGEDVVIDYSVKDPENDNISVKFSGWMTSPKYTTTYDDAGSHHVTLTANDETHKVSKDISIEVINVNRAPVIQKPEYDVIALEGEKVELDIAANDPDGDEIALSYEKPFESDGTWQTSKGDAGEYDITISATDGTDTVSIEVPVTVISTNKAPVLEEIAPITVKEGEDVVINAIASDADGDKLTTTFSGWMNSSTYTTNYNDAGTHLVTVTVSDGKEEVNQNVTITVTDVNRPPVFIGI